MQQGHVYILFEKGEMCYNISFQIKHLSATEMPTQNILSRPKNARLFQTTAEIK